jgi:hypothetical protein
MRPDQPLQEAHRDARGCAPYTARPLPRQLNRLLSRPQISFTRFEGGNRNGVGLPLSVGLLDSRLFLKELFIRGDLR